MTSQPIPPSAARGAAQPLRPRTESPPKASRSEVAPTEAEDVFERWGSNHPGIDFDDNDSVRSQAAGSGPRSPSPAGTLCELVPAELAEPPYTTLPAAVPNSPGWLTSFWCWLTACCRARG